MREVHPYHLWLGTAADRRDVPSILDAGIAALVDVALNEPPVLVAREMIYCRFPLVDGSDNPPWLLKAAIETTASLLRARTPTLVCCGAGMSRSPAVAAGALALTEGLPVNECLVQVTKLGACDVSAGLWQAVCDVLRQLQAETGRPVTSGA